MKPSRKQPSLRVLRKLSSQAAEAAAQAPDPLGELARAIKTALQSEADPYVMLGVLLEGFTQTMVSHIPAERHDVTVAAALVTLRERLAERGAPPPARSHHPQTSNCN